MVQLESSKLFCELTPNEAAAIKAVTQQRSFAAGQLIFHEGAEGDGMYIIADGVVQISSRITFGEPLVLSLLHPGDHFGEMAVIDSDPRSATATAKDDAILYFIPRADLLRLMDHIPHLAMAFVREISRRLREFNHQYIREVLESERLALVGRFASSIVHDLKNPLNIIGLSSELSCLPNATPEARQRSKERIAKQVERISNMVNELLEFARGSQTNFVLARVAYPEYVRQMLDDIRPETELKSVTLVLENEPPNVRMRINPPRLTRVFHNFINNATDAMQSGGNIYLRFRLTDRELITEVQDSGKGIAPEIAGRLFQAFATYGKANGTGLGLSICKKIIQDHQGRIYAQNAPNGGAIFGFALPFDPAEAS